MEAFSVNNSRSRTAAEDDGGDHTIGYDTPRSGVATPQPDLHDRRLPGIISCFGQVRSVSLSLLHRKEGAAKGRPSQTLDALPSQQLYEKGSRLSAPVIPSAPMSGNDFGGDGSAPGAYGSHGSQADMSHGSGEEHTKHPYPTPPASQPSSVRELSLRGPGCNDDGSAGSRDGMRTSQHKKSTSDGHQFKDRGTPLKVPLTGVVTTSTVHASHFSNPSSRTASIQNSPSRPTFSLDEPDASVKPAQVEKTRKLTGAGEKSGPPTPTRTLSTARPSQDDDGASGDGSLSSNGTRSSSKAPVPGPGQVPATKGKLTIKIIEGRNLRRSRDPYVVAVFQRSELISGAAHSYADDEDASVAPLPTGGIPMKRQGSDSGRPPMAIPMRSRQSSNTSITDHATFRSRNRRSFTKPRWGAEAVL